MHNFDIKLTYEEFQELLELFDVLGEERVKKEGIVVTTITYDKEFRRECPGRNGSPCEGNGIQELEFRNMGKGLRSVRAQSCCQKCRP